MSSSQDRSSKIQSILKQIEWLESQIDSILSQIRKRYPDLTRERIFLMKKSTDTLELVNEIEGLMRQISLKQEELENLLLSELIFSSKNLESLTKRLNWATVILLIAAVLTLGVSILTLFK
ncbi:MAG: hypothetical protein ACYCQJ_09140 [Nitrososphaerales archaeon]